MSNPDSWKIRSIAWQVTLTVAASGAALWVLYTLRMVILLLALTVIFCYLVLPLVDLLHRPGKRLTIPRTMAVVVVYLGLIGLTFWSFERVVPLLSDQVNSFLENLPVYLRQFDQTVKWLASLPARYRLPLGWRGSLTELINGMPLRLLDSLQALASRTFEITLYLPWLVLIPVIGFFFLKDGAGFHRRLIESLPEEDLRFRIGHFLQDVSRTLAAYTRAQFLACLIVGLVQGLGFWALGISYPLILALAAGVLEFVPVLGPFLLFIIAFLVAGLTSWKTALIVAALLLVFRVVQDYIIYPRLVSEGLELHPVMVILAVVCGAELAGIVGVFLSVPVAALLLVCARHWRSLALRDKGPWPKRVGIVE